MGRGVVGVLVAVLVLAVWAGDVAADPARQADDVAAMEVSVAPVGTCFTMGSCEIEILLENAGDASLSEVSVTETYCPQGVTGPEVGAGADDVLGPGEVWRYTCLHQSEVVGHAVARASATTPDDRTVTAQAMASFFTVSPFAIDVSTAVNRVFAGDSVTWRITVGNRGDYPLVGVAVEGRVLFPGWTAPITNARALGPDESGTDGDGVLAPGEVWTWTFTQPVEVDGSYLAVEVWGAPQWSPLSWFGDHGQSDAIMVEPPPASEGY